MMKSLRITATFNDEIATKFPVSGLNNAIIIDDVAGILHQVIVEHKIVNDQLYRRLTYTMKSMHSGQDILTVKNRSAQELLYPIALALSGNTLSDRQFSKDMLILPRDQVWDDEFPEGDKEEESES